MQTYTVRMYVKSMWWAVTLSIVYRPSFLSYTYVDYCTEDEKRCVTQPYPASRVPTNFVRDFYQLLKHTYQKSRQYVDLWPSKPVAINVEGLRFEGYGQQTKIVDAQTRRQNAAATTTTTGASNSDYLDESLNYHIRYIFLALLALSLRSCRLIRSRCRHHIVGLSHRSWHATYSSCCCASVPVHLLR